MKKVTSILAQTENGLKRFRLYDWISLRQIHKFDLLDTVVSILDSKGDAISIYDKDLVKEFRFDELILDREQMEKDVKENKTCCAYIVDTQEIKINFVDTNTNTTGF